MAALEFISEIERRQKCDGCGREHTAHPLRLSDTAMTWPLALCANQSCPSFGHEMGLVS